MEFGKVRAVLQSEGTDIEGRGRGCNRGNSAGLILVRGIFSYSMDKRNLA